MKKILFVLVAVLVTSSSILNLTSCTNTVSTNSVVHDTIYNHYWDPEESGVSAMLIGVRFSNLKIGTAVGAGGAIIRTVNGGDSWSSQYSGTSADLYAVSLSDNNNGMAVGSSGVVISTSDGGANWTPLAVDIDVQFRNVQMINSQTAYIVGSRYFSVDNTKGYIYKTIDGGLTWSGLTIDAPGLYGISFIDSKNGWVSGLQGAIFRTSDGGATWTKQNSTVPTTQQVTQVSFTDANHGVAVGVTATAGVPGIPTTGFIARTSDGGATWSTIVAPPLSGLWMPDADHGFAVGYSGTVMETVDGGANWTTKNVGTVRLMNVFMNDQNNGAMVGENGKVYIVGAH